MKHAIDQTAGQPLALSPADAGISLGLSTRAVYQRLASGELRSYKDGKRRLIPRSECQHYLARKLLGGVA